MQEMAKLCVGGEKGQVRPKMGQITEQAERAAQCCEFLHNVITQLESRLETVLLPTAPATTDQGKSETSKVCLASAMSYTNDKVDIATARIRDIIDRCEI